MLGGRTENLAEEPLLLACNAKRAVEILHALHQLLPKGVIDGIFD
jgi:hypothetical protein